jgi:WD40 repeat protein
MDIRFNPDNQGIATTSWDHVVSLWSIAPDQSTYLRQGAANFIRNGDRLAVFRKKALAAILEVTTGKQIYAQELSDDSHAGLWCDNAECAAATAAADGSVRIWDAETGKTLTTLVGHSTAVRNASVSSDGREILTVSDDNSARIWDLKSGRQRLKLVGHTGPVNAGFFSPDGGRIATRSEDQSVRVWDASDGRLLSSIAIDSGAARLLRFSADGSVLIIKNDGVISLWRATGESIAKLKLGESSNSTWNLTRFSLDGAKLAVTLADNSIEIWDIAKGERVSRLSGHLANINDIAFSPDGTRVATGSDDRSVRVWNASSGAQLALFVESSVVNAVQFDAYGRVLSASEDHTTKLWDPAIGKLVRTFETPVESDCSPGAVCIRNANLIGVVASEAGGHLRVITAARDERLGTYLLFLWNGETGGG